MGAQGKGTRCGNEPGEEQVLISSCPKDGAQHRGWSTASSARRGAEMFSSNTSCWWQKETFKSPGAKRLAAAGATCTKWSEAREQDWELYPALTLSLLGACKRCSQKKGFRKAGASSSLSPSHIWYFHMKSHLRRG